MARMALCQPVRAVTRSREQESADERCGGSSNPPPRGPPSLDTNFIPRPKLWGGTQRKRRDEEARTGPWGMSPQACTGPTASALSQVGSLFPAGSEFPQTQPGVPGRASWPDSRWSHGAEDRAGQQGRGFLADAEERHGAARAEYVLDSRATPRWVPVLPCLSLPSYGMGAGGRLWRQRGQAEAWSRALQGAATCRWPPSNAAPGWGS